jgi:hypothetical protein
VRTDLSRCSVNLAGSWNQAIFTPEWVRTRLMNAAAPPPLPNIGFLPVGIFIRFDIERAFLVILPGQIQIGPLEDAPEAWEDCERFARLILEKLPETPVQAFGINFGFDLEETAEVQAVMDLVDVGSLQRLGSTLELTAVVRRVRWGGHVVNLTVAQEGKTARLDVNHHFDVPGALAARDALQGAVRKALEFSMRIAKETYGARGTSQ